MISGFPIVPFYNRVPLIKSEYQEEGYPYNKANTGEPIFWPQPRGSESQRATFPIVDPGPTCLPREVGSKFKGSRESVDAPP